MTHTRLATFLITLSTLITLSACADDLDSDSDSDSDSDDPIVETQTLVWQLDGLAPLADGLTYEGWLIIDDAPVSTGRFNVDADGVPELDSFEIASEMADAATAFVLTLEPTQGDDPAPADSKILGGNLADGAAALSIAHPAALGDDFLSATGSFILETPSSAATDDANLGIWWLDPAGGPGPALDLPTLPAGWTYEGWVVGADGPISTGRFTDLSAMDDDGAGPTSGPGGSPPFPGQDFIDPAMDLVGLTAVISVEPVPDDGPAPFLLKPLVDGTIDDVGGGVLQPMANNAAATNPSGSVAFE